LLSLPKTNSVHFSGRFFEVQAKQKSSAKSLLRQWYRERAKMKFAEIAEPWIKRFEKYHVKPEAIYLQEMPARWGSCTPKGRIILNPELIKAPKPCIEYVIIHELCHLIHPNHTTACPANLIAELQARVARYENPKISRNSSIPPIHDYSQPPKTQNLREPSGKKPGD
jgi:hypothetical protein